MRTEENMRTVALTSEELELLYKKAADGKICYAEKITMIQADPRGAFSFYYEEQSELLNKRAWEECRELDLISLQKMLESEAMYSFFGSDCLFALDTVKSMFEHTKDEDKVKTFDLPNCKDIVDVCYIKQGLWD
ncbi:MAG: hypothetical protein J6C85_07205 [Alphaproteobacteria bacterium]|nr:hypothetical protein [Alphaproteobacteria bacterium]